MTEESQAHALLKDYGVSITRPRISVLRTLMQEERAMTAHTIYQLLAAQQMEVPLSSIYVNLKKLEQCGLVRRFTLESGGKSVYALTRAQGSIQMVCSACGTVQWLNDPRMEEAVKPLCLEHKQTLRNFTMVAETICHRCEEKLKKK